MYFIGICIKSQFDTCLISFSPFKRYVMLLLLLRFWMQRWLSHILKWTLCGKIQGIFRVCYFFNLYMFNFQTGKLAFKWNCFVSAVHSKIYLTWITLLMSSVMKCL